MGDEDDRQTLADQLAQVGEELVDLLRHEHRGRLVQDEDPGAPVEDLQDLHPLAGPDAQVLDGDVGVDAEAVRVGDLPDPPARGAEVEGDPALAGLAAEDHVLQHGEVVGQHEVLVDHADAHGDRLPGGAEAHVLAVDADPPLVRALHAVQDLHEGGLARAVLADDGVHVPLPYG
ncbi:hypothetical protein GCM10018952_65220 [Streptosporangium vulgare]